MRLSLIGSLFVLLFVFSCSTLKKTSYSAQEINMALTTNCSHPIVKEAKYGVIPVKLQFVFDNPNTRISSKDGKIYFEYNLKLEALGLDLKCDNCVFSTTPKIINGQVNFSDNFKLENVDCIGGPDWLKSVFSAPQELIVKVFAGNPHEIVQCAVKNLPKQADTVYIDGSDNLIIK